MNEGNERRAFIPRIELARFGNFGTMTTVLVHEPRLCGLVLPPFTVSAVSDCIGAASEPKSVVLKFPEFSRLWIE